MRQISYKKQDLFLEAFKKHGTIMGACRETGLARRSVDLWRKHPDFLKKFEDVDQDVTETLEASALQRALAGDTILTIFLLKSRRPQKYRDNHRLELSGKDGHPLTVQIVNYAGAANKP